MKRSAMMFRTTEEFNKALHNKASSKLQLGGTTSTSPTISDRIGGVVPYASNIVNMFRKLPKVQKPELQKNLLNPELVNYDADVNETNRLIRGLDAGVTTANGATGNAIKANNLGKFLEQRNKLRQSQKNTNAGIKNDAQRVNLGIEEGNLERMNDYKRAVTERAVAGQRLQTENLANFSNKFQQAGRDKNMFELESRKLDLLPTLFKETGVLTRNMLPQLNAERAKLGLPPLEHLPPTSNDGEIVPPPGATAEDILRMKATSGSKKFGGKLKSNKLSSYLGGGRLNKKPKLASLLDYV